MKNELIKYNGVRVLTLHTGVKLMPGINQVPEGTADKMKKHPVEKLHFSESCEVVGSAEPDEGSLTLGRPSKEVVEQVKNTFDVDTLRAMKAEQESQDKPGVAIVNAIDKQLADIEAQAKKTADDTSDL